MSTDRPTLAHLLNNCKRTRALSIIQHISTRSLYLYICVLCVCMCVCVRAPVSIVFVFVRIFVTIFALSPNHFADSRWRLRLLFLAFVLCSLLAMILSLSSSLILIYSNIVGWFAHELGRQASETDHHGQLGAR